VQCKLRSVQVEICGRENDSFQFQVLGLWTVEVFEVEKGTVCQIGESIWQCCWHVDGRNWRQPHLGLDSCKWCAVAYPGILFTGFKKFSWGQRTERTGIWGWQPPGQGFWRQL